jgi:hypothetical protein
MTSPPSSSPACPVHGRWPVGHQPGDQHRPLPEVVRLGFGRIVASDIEVLNHMRDVSGYKEDGR